jgi:hypothetical protein
MAKIMNTEMKQFLCKNGSDIVMAQGAEAGGHRSLFNNNNKGAHVDDNDDENRNEAIFVQVDTSTTDLCTRHDRSRKKNNARTYCLLERSVRRIL